MISHASANILRTVAIEIRFGRTISSGSAERMLSVIIPAHNEEDYLGSCLAMLLASHAVEEAGVPVPVQIIVAANACTDRTVAIAHSYAPVARSRGWTLQVLDLERGGKTHALNAAEPHVSGSVRAYVDADILVGPALLAQTWTALRGDAPLYASGSFEVAPAATLATRAYREIYKRVPFVTRSIPGAGYFSVNAAGRRRWDRFPEIIADDLFVRLNFAPEERIRLEESFRWELVEGFAALVRVRRRQDQGTRELLARFPELARNEDKPSFAPGELRALILRFPAQMTVYTSVKALARLTSFRKGWARGR
jgi:glycosyltransferase involved in cell wall biosynthesis